MKLQIELNKSWGVDYTCFSGSPKLEGMGSIGWLCLHMAHIMSECECYLLGLHRISYLAPGEIRPRPDLRPIWQFPGHMDHTQYNASLIVI